jgi:sphinganine C4-monooxygenase
MIDSWQYFLHRAMHVNKWMYKHLHSVHHRLYVPYAYGALYNHPVEGFLLDTLGAVVAEAASGMTIRQATLLFAVSTFKTVDDHCGYKLPFDLLQWLSSNDADYHDIHHQVSVFFIVLPLNYYLWPRHRRSSASNQTSPSPSLCIGMFFSARA